MDYVFDKIISYLEHKQINANDKYKVGNYYIISDYALLNIADVRYIFTRPNTSLAIQGLKYEVVAVMNNGQHYVLFFNLTFSEVPEKIKLISEQLLD